MLFQKEGGLISYAADDDGEMLALHAVLCTQVELFCRFRFINVLCLCFQVCVVLLYW